MRSLCCRAVTRRSEAAMPLAASEPIGLALRPRAASRLADLTVALRDFGRRRRAPITVLGSLVTVANPRVPARRVGPKPRRRTGSLTPRLTEPTGPRPSRLRLSGNTNYRVVRFSAPDTGALFGAPLTSEHVRARPPASWGSSRTSETPSFFRPERSKLVELALRPSTPAPREQRQPKREQRAEATDSEAHGIPAGPVFR